MTEVKDVEKYFAPSISIVYEVSASVCQDFIVRYDLRLTL